MAAKGEGKNTRPEFFMPGDGGGLKIRTKNIQGGRDIEFGIT